MGGVSSGPDKLVAPNTQFSGFTSPSAEYITPFTHDCIVSFRPYVLESAQPTQSEKSKTHTLFWKINEKDGSNVLEPMIERVKPMHSMIITEITLNSSTNNMGDLDVYVNNITPFEGLPLIIRIKQGNMNTPTVIYTHILEDDLVRKFCRVRAKDLEPSRTDLYGKPKKDPCCGDMNTYLPTNPIAAFVYDNIEKLKTVNTENELHIIEDEQTKCPIYYRISESVVSKARTYIQEEILDQIQKLRQHNLKKISFVVVEPRELSQSIYILLKTETTLQQSEVVRTHAKKPLIVISLRISGYIVKDVLE